jgi:hypothetical protein
MTTRWNRLRVPFIILAAGVVVGGSAATGSAAADHTIAISAETMKFTPIPGLPSCASASILRGDPRTGPAWVLLKLASGCRVPWHWHTANEDLVVISGQGAISMKDGPPLQFAPGAYTSLPSHHAHRASCSRACLLFNSADGAFDVHYVDDSGEEISLEQALEQAAKATTKTKATTKKKGKTNGTKR